MSQLRLNPLNGRWVTIVAERAERPSDFAPRLSPGRGRPGPSRARSAPATRRPLRRRSRRYGRDGKWLVRVVPNLYPAFFGDDPMTVRTLGPVHVQAAASGIHEVLVLSPRTPRQLGRSRRPRRRPGDGALRDRLEDHGRRRQIRYTQAIVNHGREAGASLTHPHGQLLGMPFVPGEILDEERAFARFEGGCILCATVEAELADAVPCRRSTTSRCS